jgi:hypothetical protein
MAGVNLSVGDAGLKTEPLKAHAQEGLTNYHANVLNTGKDDSKQQKAMRMAAMKRRMSKGY